jgi:hypothetical protein
MIEIVGGVLAAGLTGLASFLGAWSAVRTHLDYLRRDVDLAHRRIDQIQEGQRCSLKHG